MKNHEKNSINLIWFILNIFKSILSSQDLQKKFNKLNLLFLKLFNNPKNQITSLKKKLFTTPKKFHAPSNFNDFN